VQLLQLHVAAASRLRRNVKIHLLAVQVGRQLAPCVGARLQPAVAQVVMGLRVLQLLMSVSRPMQRGGRQARTPFVSLALSSSAQTALPTRTAKLTR
jgi:hypothetical protein